MRGHLSDNSAPAFEDTLCPPAPASTREILRSCPPNSFAYTHKYRRDRWKDQIDQEQAEALKTCKQVQRTENRRPYKDEYSKVCQRIEAKYRRLDFEADAKAFLWEQSERIVNLYRTKGLTPPPDDASKRQGLFKFVQTVELDSFPELTADASHPFAPNQYFELTQPSLVAQYGLPFYSTVAEPINPQYGCPTMANAVEEIIGINTDFWAAMLGGDERLMHDCVFSAHESRFYYFDLVLGCYVTTTEAKVALWLSQSIQQRAWGQDVATATMILDKCRTKKLLDEILNKAKAILAADENYFDGPDARPRWGHKPKVNPVEVVTSFVQEHVEPADGFVMSLAECLEHLERTCPVGLARKDTVQTVNAAIRAQFKRGLRHDLVLENGRGSYGWKGLRLRVSRGGGDAMEQGYAHAGAAESAVEAGTGMSGHCDSLVLTS